MGSVETSVFLNLTGKMTYTKFGLVTPFLNKLGELGKLGEINLFPEKGVFRADLVSEVIRVPRWIGTIDLG